MMEFFQILKAKNKNLLFLTVGFVFIYSTIKSQAPGICRLVYPKNQVVLDDSAITFSWEKDFYNNLTYHLQIADNAGFINPIVDATGLTAEYYPFSNFTYGVLYYWRVEAINTLNISSGWSATNTFSWFRPDKISGLAVWMDPTLGITTNGGYVSSWNDRSSNNNNANQVSVTQRPLYISRDSLINNKPILSYDGTNDFLEIADNATIDLGSQFSIHVVVRPRVIQTNKTILAKWDYPTQGSWAFQTDYSTNNELMFATASSLTDANGVSVQTSNAQLKLLNYYRLTLEYNGSLSPLNTVKLFENFNPVNKSYQGALVSSLPNSTATLKIGKYGGTATRYYNGDIGEIIIYNHTLTDPERTLVDQYLRYKYSPPVNLGNDTVLSSFCDTLKIKANYNFKSYLWSTGDTTSFIKVSKSGKYWVDVTDQFGNTSSDTIRVFYPYDINTPTTGFVCYDETLEWNTKYPKSNFTFQWQDNSTDSLFNITQPGQYYVKIKDVNNCYFYSDTIDIALDNFPIIASLGPDTTMCSGNSLYLKSGASQAVAYEWGDGTHNTILPVTSSGRYLLKSTSINGCINIDSVNVVIHFVAPTVNFTFDTACLGSATNFKDVSLPPGSNTITSRLWDFGDLNTLSTASTNLSHTYNDSGAYAVKLTITTNKGCIDSKTHAINVIPNPQANFTSTNLCATKYTAFNGIANTFGYAINQWNWDFNDPSSGINNNSSLQNTTHIFNSMGTYTVQLIATNLYNCSDTAEILTTLQSVPNASFTYSNTCINDITRFYNTTPTSFLYSIQNYYWDFDDLTTSAQANPIKVFSQNGTYNVLFVITTSDGCVDSTITPVSIYPKPVSSYTYSNACVNVATSFVNNSSVSVGSITNSLWNFGDNSANSTITSPQHIYTDTVSAIVKLVSTTDQGCKDSLTKVVKIHSLPGTSFIPSATYGSPPLTVMFDNTTAGTNSYWWDFGNGQVSNGIDPGCIYNSVGNYSVILTATNTYGCTASYSQSIDVTEKIIDIEIKSINTTYENGYLTVSANISNNSSIDITGMDINLYIYGVGDFKLSWSGLLIRGGLLLYTFPTTISINSPNRFICLSIENPNGLADEIPTNNEMCKNLNPNTFDVLNPYPNPAKNKVTIPLQLNENKELSIALYNMLGEKMTDIITKQEILKGIQLIEFDVTGIAEGVYNIQINSGNQFIVKQILIEK